MVPVQQKSTLPSSPNPFFIEILSNISTLSGKQNLLSYVYSSKLEKTEYIDFLQAIMKSQLVTPEQMQALSDDILAVSNNNVLPKYVLDKWVFQIT